MQFYSIKGIKIVVIKSELKVSKLVLVPQEKEPK